MGGSGTNGCEQTGQRVPRWCVTVTNSPPIRWDVAVITAERLTVELDKAFALWGGPALVLRMDNRPEAISLVLRQFCGESHRALLHPAGTPWNNGHIESFNNRLRKECLNRNHWSTLLEARVVIGDFKEDHNTRHRHSALGLPHAGRVRCRLQMQTHPGGLQYQLNLDHTNPTPRTGGLRNGDSPHASGVLGPNDHGRQRV
jgi:hypothetical protein